MKLVTTINFEREITKYEGHFDYDTFEYKDVSETKKQDICENFNKKKFRLVFDLSHKTNNEEGYSVHATASHLKKAEMFLKINEAGITMLSIKSDVEVPLKITSKKASDFNLNVIHADIFKGSSDEVKLYFDKVKVVNFGLVN